MRRLCSYLCEILKCDIDELDEHIRDNFKKTYKVLKGLPLYTSHNDECYALRCDGVTRAGPRTILACGGQLGITLEQNLYSKCRIILNHPQMPCIVVRYDDTASEVYYPIELVLVDL